MQRRVDLPDADPFELADILQDAGVGRRHSPAVLHERHPTREAAEADRVFGGTGGNGTDAVELPVAAGVLVDVEGELESSRIGVKEGFTSPPSHAPSGLASL